MAEQSLTGYRRPDGRVGVRNHVVILPVDDLSNAVCEHIAAAVPGTLPLPHAYGRLQYGPDLELTFRTLIGTGANPNVAAPGTRRISVGNGATPMAAALWMSAIPAAA